MKLICKTKGGENSREMYRIFLSAHPDEYAEFVAQIIPEIHRHANCAVFYKDDASLPISEEYLSEFNLIIVSVTHTYLCEPNIARDTELSAAKRLHLPILPIMQSPNLEIEYSAYFGKLQYLARFSYGGGSIDYDEKLSLYLSERIIPTPLIDSIAASFSATLFLSYRKVDRVLAQRIITLLHGHEAFRSVAVWYDEYLTPGESFDTSIEQVLDKSLIFLLAVTKNMVGEDNYVTRHEFPMAKEKKIALVPIVIEEVEESLLNGRFPDLPDCIDISDADAIIARITELLRERGIAPSPDSCSDYLIALAYFMGIYLERNIDIAISIFKRCAECGYAEAMETLARIYSEGERTEKNLPLAIDYQKKLVRHRRREYRASKMPVVHNQYMEALAGLVRLYIERGNFISASRLARTLTDSHANCSVPAYRVGIFEELLALYGYTGNRGCRDMARSHILRADYYPAFALAYRVLSLTDECDREARAREYYEILTDRYSRITRAEMPQAPNPNLAQLIRHLAREYLPNAILPPCLERDDETPSETAEPVKPPPRVEKYGEISLTEADTEPLMPPYDTDGEPLLPLDAEGGTPMPLADSATDGGLKPWERHLRGIVIPNWRCPSFDGYIIFIPALCESLRMRRLIKSRRYSTEGGVGDLERADVFSRYLAARAVILDYTFSLGNDLDERVADWLSGARLTYENGSTARRVAAIYERLLDNILVDTRLIEDRLCEVYEYLCQSESYDYTWLRKHSILQALRAERAIGSDRQDDALTYAKAAYSLMKSYAAVSKPEGYRYDLGICSFCVGSVYEATGAVSDALVYYGEAIELLLMHADSTEERATEQYVKLYLSACDAAAESGFDMLKSAQSLIDDYKGTAKRRRGLAACMTAYGRMNEKYGTKELALFYKREAVRLCAETYHELGDVALCEYAEAICALAERLLGDGEADEAFELCKKGIELLCDIPVPTASTELLLAKLETLRGWIFEARGEYSDAVISFTRAAQRISGERHSAQKETVSIVLFKCYKGMYHSYRALGKRREARESLRHAIGCRFASEWKRDFASSLFDVFNS